MAAKLMFRVLDNRIRVEGTEHIPSTGGAVIACNHVSYLDFIFCGLGAQPHETPGQVHGEEGDLRQPHRRTAHARHAPHLRRSRRRSRVVPRSRRAPEGRGGRRRVPRGHDQPVVHREGHQVRRGPDGRRGRCPGRADGAVGHAAAVDQGPPEGPHQTPRPDLDPRRRADASEGRRGCRSPLEGPSRAHVRARGPRPGQATRRSRRPTTSAGGCPRTSAAPRRRRKRPPSWTAKAARPPR